MSRIAGATLTLLFALLLVARPVAAQGTTPPIQGVTGTIATEGSRDGVKKAAGAAARGVRKILPGTKGDTTNPLDVLIAGSHVVVREGSADATGVEAIVIDVNKGKQQITVRRPDKKTDTLRLMNARATSGSGPHVVVSLADVTDAKTYDFRRLP
jgi:hypothetical protein